MPHQSQAFHISGGVGGPGGEGCDQGTGGGGGPGEGPTLTLNFHITTEHFTNNLYAAGSGVSLHQPLDAVRPTAPDDGEFQNVQITILLQPTSLVLADEISGLWSTHDELTRHDLVAWKVITLSMGKNPTTVRMPKDLGFGGVDDSKGILDDSFFCLAPPATLVTKTTQSWKPAPFSNLNLSAMVLAKNAAGVPEDFSLGTCHAERNGPHRFSPFLVIRGVQPGQLCSADQCGDLRVNAYVTENIQERQILAGLFNTRNDSGPRNLSHSTSVEEGDLTPKILSPPLMGENGPRVSSLEPIMHWRLVKHGRDLKLEVVSHPVLQ
ncbi:hypothetical protein K438DRAFT_1839807 [Mycena galopus ATCC 62051]|nr:hypothetical protein K438DRAFT_1839807 [Mycena galopus ATCC 62051]